MIEIVYLIFVILISFELGQKIFRLIGVKFDRYLEKFIFSFPLGLAVLGYVTFILGIIGLLYKSILMTVLVFLFIFLIKDIKNLMLSLFKIIKNINKKRLIKKYKIGFNFFTILFAFTAAFILLNFIVSFAPPWNFDVLAYHLAIQKIYIRAHKIINIPYILFSNFPNLVNTIYLDGLLLHNGMLANLFAYALDLTLVLSIFSFCRRFFNWKVGLLSLLIFYSFPMVIELSSTTHTDIQLALFFFLSIYGLFVYLTSKNEPWLYLCSIFAGFGVSSKIFGVIAAIGILSVLIMHFIPKLAKREVSYKSVLIKIFICCIIILIITMPWLIKNYFFTGNPVWPALNEVFNGKYWDAKHQQALSNLTSRKITIMNYLRLPWDIHAHAGKAAGAVGDYEGIGPFFLAFLPLYFLLNKKNKILNIFFVLIFIYVTIWFFLSYILRYIIFAMPLVAIISAYVIVELLKNNYISNILKILLIFTFSFCILVWLGGKLKEIPVVLGLETKEAFYSKYPGPIYKASKFINQELPENSKILLFRDNRGFFLDRNYVWGDPLLQVYLNHSKFKNETDFYQELKRLGITHILVNKEFEWRDFIVNDYRYNKRILNMTDNLLKKHTINLYDKGGISINELRQNEQ